MIEIINGRLIYLGFQGNSFKDLSNDYLNFILTSNN